MGGPSKQFPQSKKKNEDEDLKDMSKIFKPVTLSANAQKIGAGNHELSLRIFLNSQALQMLTQSPFSAFSSNKASAQKGGYA
jgi:hypothetical protein